jgi:hypothetical protein
MGKLTQQISEPFSSVSDRPWHFFTWWFVANIFGLAGFWLPILLVWGGGGAAAASKTFRDLVYAGTLASFSVVLLADGIASVLIVVGGGSNITAAGMRGLVGCVAFLLASVQVGVLVFAHSGADLSHPSASFQIILTALAIALASYLYCFRFPSWEKDVNEVKEKEDREVNGLGVSAQRKSTDGEGTKL